MRKGLLDWKILLASQSPRRRDLIQKLNLPVEIVQIPETDESFPEEMDSFNVPVFLSKKKALEFKGSLKKNEVLLTADTIVLCKNKIINKPKDRMEAIDMLTGLAGNKHTVITGVCLKLKNMERTFYSTTEVYFSHLSEEEIIYYVDKYKPYDKAGAYGIQEWIGYIGVEKIEGSFFNVMGLPLHRLYEELKRLEYWNTGIVE